MTATDTEPTYLFGPRDRRTLLLGMRLPQLVLLATGGAALLFGFLSQSRYGVPLGLLGCLATVALAFVPVQGRPVIDWVRPLANYLHGRLSGQGTYLGGPWAVARSHTGCSGAPPPGGWEPGSCSVVRCRTR